MDFRITNSVIPVSPSAQETLLKLAHTAIEHGLQHGKPLVVEVSGYPEKLQLPQAVFVTLTRKGELRGCIGTLEATLPLVSAVAKYAYAAAFSDPRFVPICLDELNEVRIHISVLSRLNPLAFSSERELLEQIRPGIDGLLLEDGYHRGTLLPSVWEDIPEKTEFLRRLKLKAGLSSEYWSQQLTIKRYTAFCFS